MSMTRTRSTRLALGVLGLAVVLGLARVAVALLGDVSGDGSVNNTDAQHVQEGVVGTRTLTPAQLADADVDGDGDVDVSDAQQIRQFAAGLLTGFPVRAPQQSGPIALTRDGGLLGVVNPDTNTATFVATGTEAVLDEVPIGREPTGIAFARDGGRALVAVGRDAEVAVVDTETLAVTNRIPVGVEPFGVVVNFRGDRAYVSNLASGTVSVIDLATETVIDEVPVAPKPEGLAVTADSGRVFVTHLFGGQVSVIDTATHAVSSIPLAVLPFDENNPTQPAGKTNRMKGIAIHPVRSEAWLPHILSNSDNVVETLFNTTIFPAVGVLDTQAPAELGNARMTLFAGLATVVSNPEAVAFTPDGDLGLMVSAASNDLTFIDATTRQQVGLVRDVGDNPRGIAVHPNGTRAYVFNRLTPAVSVVDVVARTLLRQIAVSHDPLPPNVANGRRLFFTSAPPEVAQDRFFGCEACHFDGRDDGQTWFFTNGPRQTLSLAGTTANTGLLHHNGDRKNVQDFAFTFTRLQNGTGVSPDQLDDVADFVDTSIRFLENPSVNPDLSRTAAGRRGRRLFRGAADCARCHAGPFLTDATGHTDPTAPLLHDVGIFAEGVLTQDEFDKTRDQEGIAEGTVRPAGAFESTFLLGVFGTAPYLHDGRAATLRDTLTVHNAGDRHGTTSTLTPAQIDDLVAYLEQIDVTQARVEITFPADGARVAGLAEVAGNVLPEVEGVDVFVNGAGPIPATVAAGRFTAAIPAGLVPAVTPGTRFDLTALATTTGGEPGRDDVEVEANFSGPGTVDLGRSTVEADPVLIPSDGVATSLITITPRDAANRPVGSGLDIQASATAGTLGPVLDVGDGRYVALLTAATSAGSAIVSARHAGGAAFADTAQVFFAAGTVDALTSAVTVAPGSVEASVAARATVTVIPRDALGNDLGPTQTVLVVADRGTVATVVDNGDGTYTTEYTPPTTPGPARFTATANGTVLTTRPTLSIVADVTAPAAPDLSRVTFATPAGGASRATGGAGTVETSATVRLQNLTTGAPIVSTAAGSDGSFSANVPVTANQVICLRTVDAAGNVSAAACTIPFPVTVPTVRGVLRTPRAGGGFNPVAGAVVQLEIANLTDPLAPSFTPFAPPLTTTTGADGAFAIVLPPGFVPDPNLAVTAPGDVFALVNDVERTVLVDQISSVIVFMIGFNDLLLDLPAPFPAANFTPEERAAIEDALRPATTEINFFGLDLEDALQAVADDVFFDTARDFLDLTAFAVFKVAAESPGSGGSPTIVRGRLTVPSATGPRPLAGVQVDLATFGFTGCGFPICVSPIAGASGVTNAAGEYSLALPGFIAPGSSTVVVAIGNLTYGAFGLPGPWTGGGGLFPIGGFVTDPAANADVDLAGRVAMSLLGNEGAPLVNYNRSEMDELLALLRTKLAATPLVLAGKTLQQVFVDAFNAMAGDNGVTALIDAIKDAETGDNSNVTASPTTLEADGVSVSTITVEPLGPSGERVGPGLLVELSTTAGTITTPALDNHDGTYTGFLRAPTAPASATVTARVEGTALSEQPTVTFTADVTAPGAPDADRVIFVGVGATTATVIGLPGTAEAGSLVTIINTTRGTTVTVRASDDGSFRADIFGSVGDDLDVRVADAAGNLSGTTDLDVAGGLALPAIVNPAAVPSGVVPVFGPLAAADLGVAVPAGFGFVGGFTLGLGEKTATTALDVVAAASGPVPAGKALLLAQVITARGNAELRVVAPALAAGGVLFQRLGAAIPGVLTGGRYAFLSADAPQAFVVGTVDGSRGAIAGVHMTLGGSPFTDLTRADGRFLVPGPLGAGRTLGAALFAHQQPDQMTARLPFAGAEVDCDFTLATRATVSFAFSGRFTGVGQVSRRMALTPAGTKLYVAETLRGDLAILDTTSLAQTSLIDDGSTLLDLAFTANGFEAFLVFAGRVRDFTTSIEEPGRVITTVGFPRRVAITPNGDLALVASSLDNALGDTTPDAVFPIDTFTNVVAAPIPVPADPVAIAVNPAGTRAYVVSAQGEVAVIDVAARSVLRTVALGGTPTDVVVKRDGTEVYVADGTANAVKVLGAATLEDAIPGNELLATIAVGAAPTSLALVPGGTKLLVSESADDTVSVIDLAGRTVGAVWATVDQPAQVAAHPSGRTAYVLDPQLQRGVLETTVAASDTTPPTVVDVGAQDRVGFLLQDSPVEVVFSERLDPATVTLANLQVRDASNTPVPGTLVPTGDGVAAVFTPLAGVRYALTSTLRIVFTTALRDAAGLPLPAGERTVPTVPMQVPDLARISVDLTTSGIEADGTGGAVEPRSAIEITNLRTGAVFRTTADGDGSFHVVLAGLDSDGFRLVTSLFGGRARTEPITLPVNFTIVIPDPAKVSYAPGPAGTLLAVGASGAVDPQASRVRIRNLTSGQNFDTTTIAPDGSFSLGIFAEQSDSLDLVVTILGALTLDPVPLPSPNLPAPVIDFVTPDRFVFGTPVTLTVVGRNFGAVPANVRLTVSGTVRTDFVLDTVDGSPDQQAVLVALPVGADSGEVQVAVAGQASNAAAFFAETPPNTSPFAEEVIDASVAGDPSFALGESDNEFTDLGPGGSLTLRLGSTVEDGPGSDLQVFEDTTDGADCYEVLVSAAEVGPFDSLGQVCGTAFVDLNGHDPIRFVRIVDAADGGNAARIGGVFAVRVKLAVEIMIQDAPGAPLRAIGGFLLRLPGPKAVTATLSSGDKQICVKGTAAFSVNVTPPPQGGGGYGGGCSDSISWSVSGGGSVSPTSGASTTFTGGDTGGQSTIVVTVIRQGNCSTAGSDSKSVKVDVVEVESLKPAEGKEQDDGDGDASTKTYVLAKTKTGTTTVTAKPKPALPEAKLPACWSLTGGTGSGKLERTVDKTMTATTTLVAKAGPSMKTTKVVVIMAQFVQDPAQKYGFDAYMPVAGGILDRSDPDVPQKSVKNGASDTAMCNIMPPADADKTFFKSTSTGIVTVAPMKATMSPETITLTGASTGSSEIQANAGAEDGQTAGKLGATSYNELSKTVALILVHEDNDDVQAIPVLQGKPNVTAITPGSNGTLDTAPVGDDTVVGGTITTGPNGITETAKSGDDVQAIAVGNGEAGVDCVTQGTNGEKDTMLAGDDVHSFLGLGDDILTGPNGICDSLAVTMDIMSTDMATAAFTTYLNNTVYNQAVVKWTVTRLPAKSVNWDLNFDGMVDVTPCFGPESNKVISEAGDSGYDHNIFLVDNPDDGSFGCAEFNQRYVFVHGGQHTGAGQTDVNTGAHELGHAQGLLHPDQNGDPDANNLMHATNTNPFLLRKTQWDQVNP